MTDKEKQIEEMARAICPNSKEWSCKACNWGAKPNCDAYKNAEKMYNTGYRKIPDGSVVLSIEEVDEFRKDSAEVKFLKNKIIEQTRKETAREILEKLGKAQNEDERYKEWADLIDRYGVEVE